MSALACPGCRAPMEREAFARKPTGGVEIDICFKCHAMWFDQFESAQLTAGSIVQLFRDIHEHRDEPPRSLPDRMRCPRCAAGLAFTQDIQRTNKITYYRCPAGHGRLTTFFQFLREKNFVRTVTQPEVEQLRAQVRQIRCSSCGGAVDLQKEMACPYCRAPVSILDPEAVSRTLKELDAQERRKDSLDVERLRQMMMATGGSREEGGRLPTGLRPDRPAPWARGAMTGIAGAAVLAGAVDLIGTALEHLIDD